MRDRSEKQREYYIKNRDAILEYHKKYQKKNRLVLNEISRKYYLENREKMLKNMRKYSIENRIALNEKGRKYREDNFEAIKMRVHQNRKVLSERARIKKKVNIQFRLSTRLRSRLFKAIRGGYKRGSAVRDLGCTIPELKMYLEGQFKDGMTWENWSFTGWHLDHKIPLAFFDLTDRSQLLQAVHYSNLQPMWAKENMSKHSKVLNK